MKISNPPSSAQLMATARSFGNYDLAAALADLIDNSIKAKASMVEISFRPGDDDVVVRIRDDGEGMDQDTLVTAMRPASAHPETERAPDDLGRFGWGLKSASLSQARVLTVVSWQRDEICAARWDIDDIDDWSMELLTGSEALDLLEKPCGSKTGTEVIWSRSDRLCDSSATTSFDEFLTHTIAHARQRLSLIFHRYLSGDGGTRLSISINGSKLEALDPFLREHPATQTLDAETIEMSNGSKIEIQPYVLPHFSKLKLLEQERLGGPEGMVRNQGFYVYRNRRLIIHGTWFRLVPHGELSQLTRVKVELPNTADNDWRITVDKSDAQLPTELKKRLQQVVKRFNRRSISVHRKKGVSLDIHGSQHVWVRTVKNGQVRYLINREHPMIAAQLEVDQSSAGGGIASAVFNLLESYFPTDQFLTDAAKENLSVNQTPTSTDEFNYVLDKFMTNYALNLSESPDVNQFLSYLKSFEPFASQWRYTEDYVRENAVKQWEMLDAF